MLIKPGTFADTVLAYAVSTVVVRGTDGGIVAVGACREKASETKG